MKSFIIFALIIGATRLGNALDIKTGPFDGPSFRPTVPVIWAENNPLPENVAVYKVAVVKLPQAIISNAMTIGSFKSINILKSKDMIEFRDKPGEYDWTRFFKMSAAQGWFKYYDKMAGTKPSHGVPNLDEVDKKALRYLTLLGGSTNQLSPRPWPHTEETFETYDKPGGTLKKKGVSRVSVCLYRQIDGLSIMGNSLSVDFGNDSKPVMLDMNWPPVEVVKRVRVKTNDGILSLVKSGKAFIQVFPPPPEDITSAKSYKVKNLIPLYCEFSGEGETLMKPYGSLLIEADMNGRSVDFAVNCSIIAQSSDSEEPTVRSQTPH